MKRALALAMSLVALACSSPDPEAKAPDPGVAPSGAEFYPVALVLVDRCGSIDCHGSKYRNMRLYGFGSQRFDPRHRPATPETTQLEADQNYNAVAALEPDIFRRVIAEGGADPERLTFVRKSRGRENHKGGTRVTPGDDADRCIQSWLQSSVDADACRRAVPRLNQ
ncbi:MAG: hypothetical protein KIT84_04500 [Labilithrix sp.]|nr:hypothetical protein [Labilithrix sp.]MCW5810246.1 hypothetical protein [Labilithrix sp.]